MSISAQRDVFVWAEEEAKSVYVSWPNTKRITQTFLKARNLRRRRRRETFYYSPVS
jgi:hypothetical protein